MFLEPTLEPTGFQTIQKLVGVSQMVGSFSSVFQLGFQSSGAEGLDQLFIPSHLNSIGERLVASGLHLTFDSFPSCCSAFDVL